MLLLLTPKNAVDAAILLLLSQAEGCFGSVPQRFVLIPIPHGILSVPDYGIKFSHELLLDWLFSLSPLLFHSSNSSGCSAISFPPVFIFLTSEGS